METQPYIPADTEDRLEMVLADFLRSRERGENPDPEEWIRRHPDLADELRSYFDNRAHLSTLVQSPRPTPPPLDDLRMLGDYELLEEIARGGMGVVYKARQKRLNRIVALKMILSGRFASAEDIQRFRCEAENAAHLDHPNIVPIYEVGECGGQHYFSMKLINGSSLATQLGHYRQDLRAGVKLLSVVARTIHYAHQRGILHRDLKPANILLDTEGQPHLTDFGLARRVEGDGPSGETGMIVGTASYMAPEQARGECRRLTTAVDVYSLGAILYELFTGQPPFRGLSTLETLRLVLEVDTQAPRQLNPKLPRDLNNICLKCLEKEPQQRYGSAEALADDLDRWLHNRPVKARPIGSVGRLARWGVRHPWSAGVLLSALLGLIAVATTAVRVARNQEATLREEVLGLNEDLAVNVASTFLLHLEWLSRPVLQTAEDPAILVPLAEGDYGRLQRRLGQKYRSFTDPQKGFVSRKDEPVFKSWYVLDKKGLIVALYPENDALLANPDFSGRDYFRGALSHLERSGAEAVHVSRIFKAENDTLYKFAISVPLTNDQGEFLGVLAATIPSSSTVGSLRLRARGREAVLIGREDLNPRQGQANKDETARYVILLHDAYPTYGQHAVELVNDKLAAVQRSHHLGPELMPPGPEARSAVDDRYRDPAGEQFDPARYNRRWIAGFAPVGNTEYVVVVQQDYQEAIGRHGTVAFELVVWGGSVVGLGLLVTILILVHNLRRTAQVQRT